MKIGYFPGCSLHGTGIEYEESLLAVAKAFGIEIVEIDDWNCCGATAAHSMNHLLSIALPARILALAEAQGFEEVLVPCAACFSRLVTARDEIKKDEHLRTQIPDIIEMPYSGSVRPVSVLEFIEKHILPTLKEKVVKPFNKTLACYYGCLLVRPPKLLNEERCEDPQQMETAMKAIGAKPLDWGYKTECCGAGLSVSETDIVAKLSGKIVYDAESRGADAIVVACPMCQSNLDMRRPEINEYLQRDSKVPALFITQVIGLAIGLSEKALGIDRLLLPAGNAVKIEAPAKQTVVKEKVEA
jgi:heterodisulfide reductase subunit B